MRTAIGYEFPTAGWLDPFDIDEPRAQWIFVNQDRISRAWVAPTDQDSGWGFAADESLYSVFNNPRSCLHCLEKSAVVSDGQVLREWSPTSHQHQTDPTWCAKYNGLFVVYAQTQQSLPIHETAKYADYDKALAEALTAEAPVGNIMIARVVHGESLW